MPFSRRILLVDDDPSIRAVAQMMLAARGFDVQTAENGFEALSWRSEGRCQTSSLLT